MVSKCFLHLHFRIIIQVNFNFNCKFVQLRAHNYDLMSLVYETDYGYADVVTSYWVIGFCSCLFLGRSTLIVQMIKYIF